MPHKIFPLCESALTIDFGDAISVEFNDRVIQLADFIKKNNFEGFIELVPAYSSLTVFYDLVRVRRKYQDFPNAFSFVENFIRKALVELNSVVKSDALLIEIPVDYSEEYALDLKFVADRANLSAQKVIELHTAKTYRVFMIGFLPAFAYLGEVDKRIAAPRQSRPRTKIAKGSVGIAGKQTGIYPLESPGGWQIIGKTETEMFRSNSREISLLKTGDFVKFYDINSK